MPRSRLASLRHVGWLLILSPAMTAPAAANSDINDVCASIDLLNRSVDRLLGRENKTPPADRDTRETAPRLAHIYQLHLSCLEQLHQIEAQKRIGRIPPLTSTRPTEYDRDDIVALSQLTYDELKRPAWMLWATRLPTEKANMFDRTLADAFAETVRLYRRMNALAGEPQPSPDAISAQLARAIGDAKAVLQHVDAAHRYRIDAPRSTAPQSITAIYAKLLEVRTRLNQCHGEVGGSTTALPGRPDGGPRGEDLFIQSQIVLGELNRLKLETGTVRNTPLPVETTGKTWNDVYDQAVMLDYLLSQLGMLRQMVSQRM